MLVATFFTDTFAYIGGRMFGSRPLAPMISPNKTIEGLVIGVVGGTAGFWLAGLYQDWLSGFDALLMGACIAVLAPLGDLFESAIKRDLDVKDSGVVFGPHGGLLDRLDAVLFTVVAGYYLAWRSSTESRDAGGAPGSGGGRCRSRRGRRRSAAPRSPAGGGDRWRGSGNAASRAASA